jgi:hypothetical protein
MLTTIPSGEILEDDSRIESLSNTYQRFISDDASGFFRQLDIGERLYRSETGSQPVDIDDYIPSTSYYAHDFHELILDEEDICRGLAGYMPGFEPQTITRLKPTAWTEDVDEEDVAEDHFADYSAMKSASRAASSLGGRSKPRSPVRRDYDMKSLPSSAAEC